MLSTKTEQRNQQKTMHTKTKQGFAPPCLLNLLWVLNVSRQSLLRDAPTKMSPMDGNVRGWQFTPPPANLKYGDKIRNAHMALAKLQPQGLIKWAVPAVRGLGHGGGWGKGRGLTIARCTHFVQVQRGWGLDCADINREGSKHRLGHSGRYFVDLLSSR